LPKHSSRLKPFFRYLNAKLFSLISGIFVIGENEIDRFLKLSVVREKIEIMGDTKYDQVLERAQKREKIAPLINHPVLLNKHVLVAGSTWPADEEVVIPAFCAVFNKHENLFMIIAPHEPHPKRIAEIKKMCQQFKLKTACWSDLVQLTKNCQCLIVDKIGLLSSIYSLGKVAFVGGSFHYKIHNVLEPAIFGIPVFFGPKMATSAEAQKLLENDAAIKVNSIEQATALLTKIFEDPTFAQNYGAKAKMLVQQNVGRSRKIAERLIARLN